MQGGEPLKRVEHGSLVAQEERKAGPPSSTLEAGGWRCESCSFINPKARGWPARGPPAAAADSSPAQEVEVCGACVTARAKVAQAPQPPAAAPEPWACANCTLENAPVCAPNAVPARG